VSGCINFVITIPIFFIFCIIDKIHFGPEFFMLLFPILCLVVFNIGVGLILSALYVFFKDIQYLYDIFTILLMYLSAIFYPISTFPPIAQSLFRCNPIYVYIDYFRQIVIYNQIPSIKFHLLCMFYAFIVLVIGMFIYKKNNYKFIYYIA
jgi:ABC-2 type transport system permease protein